ncbi:MAG: alpha/beta hydrolase-fold protein, partial [Bacteroidota bacterium]
NVIPLDIPAPELETTRRIWLYLPPDYATSQQSYPVIYMHDAQNLFDRAMSFSGEWQVDEYLNQEFEAERAATIVVGIENGGANRINELTSWPNAQYGGGQGSRYADFVVNTLKPYIDANYRTRSEREYTAVMGSSLGGLMSMYMGMKHGATFGKVGVLSPSFWWSEDIYKQVQRLGKQMDTRFYFVASTTESQSMVPDMRRMYNTLLEVGFSEEELRFKADDDGQHSEWYWAREFPAAHDWLLDDLPAAVTDTEQGEWIRIAPNPATNRVYVEIEDTLDNGEVYIYSPTGQLVERQPLTSDNSIDVSHLKNGDYLILITNNCLPVANQRLVVRR